MAGEAVICPECHKKFKGKGDLRGKKVRCPFCKEAFTVPDEDAEKEAVTAAEPAKEAAKPEGAYNRDEQDFDPYAAQDQDLKPRCPNCANEMASNDATICLFCGYNTLTREWGRTVKVLGLTPGQIFIHLLPGLGVLFCIVLLIMGLLYYCLIVPSQVVGGWLFWLDSESLRMWFTIGGMFVIWGSGMFCYKRFFLEPLPPETEKD